MNCLIRPMTPEDFNQIAPLLETQFDDFWTPKLLQEELDHPDTSLLVAIEDTEVIGFGSILKILDEAHLTNIVVKKTKRNLGIAHQILDTLIQKAKESQLTCVTLEVNEKNEVARYLYQSFDFQEVGRRKKYYHHTNDAIIMTLYLK